jgi:hypothetical protein
LISQNRSPWPNIFFPTTSTMAAAAAAATTATTMFRGHKGRELQNDLSESQLDVLEDDSRKGR